MAPRKKLLRASPKPKSKFLRDSPVRKAKATGKPKGSSPSMVLGSASKAGMQSKQGRNFLLPKSKPKRPKLKDFLPPKKNPFDRPEKPMPRPKPLKEKFPEIYKKLGPYKRNMTRDEMEKRLRQMINDRKRKK